MKTFIFSITLFILINFSSGLGINQFDNDHQTNPKHKCGGETVTTSPKFLKARQECLNEKMASISLNDKDRMKGLTCLVLCEWKKLGIVDAGGKFNEEGQYNHLMSFQLSPNRTKMLRGATEKCITDSDLKRIKYDPSDKTCASYKYFVNCIFTTYIQNCDTPYFEAADDWDFNPIAIEYGFIQVKSSGPLPTKPPIQPAGGLNSSTTPIRSASTTPTTVRSGSTTATTVRTASTTATTARLASTTTATQSSTTTAPA